MIFRPHPFSYRDPGQARLARQIQQLLKTDAERTGRSHIWGHQAERDWDIPDCFNHSDALVTDVSSVASDFLATGKPFAMVAIQQRGQAFLKEIPMARVAYVIEKDLSTLTYAVDALFGPDPLADAAPQVPYPLPRRAGGRACRRRLPRRCAQIIASHR